MLAAALAAPTAGCGDASIPIGGDPGPRRYLSPAGSDDGPGTRARPWRTFAAAVPRLTAGATLVLLDGVYDGASSGYPDLRCGVNAPNGRPDAPIRVAAEHERAAFLRGDGRTPPLFMEGCSDWIVEGLRAESADTPDASFTAEDAGSVFVLGTANQRVTLRRLLAARPNRHLHAHVLRLGPGSRDILVEECELYDFHHNGFEAVRVSGVTFRRNYVNARGGADVPGAYVSIHQGGGDYGFFFEETEGVIAENNVVETVHDGFGVAARFEDLPPGTPPVVIGNNRILGNVVRGAAGSGVVLQSRCAGAVPCDGVTEVVRGTELRDDVFIGGASGVVSTGASGTVVDRVTVAGAAAGIVLGRSDQNAGMAASSFTADTLVTGFTATAFSSVGEDTWTFDHCAALGGATGAIAFEPAAAGVRAPVVVAAAAGACPLWAPAAGPLARAGRDGGPVGATIVHRYQDGQIGARPLWDRATGAFPCGAQVDGVNTDASTSCSGVHTRLPVSSPECPLP